MILDLDFGNSRVKWRITSAAGEHHCRGVCGANQDEWMIGTSHHSIERIRVSSVSGTEQRERIKDKCMETLGVQAEFASSTPFACGISNGYEQPERLGVDRWLAVIAGFHVSKGKSCCVADCGSAITLDYVSEDGQHQGGIIAPGIRLMRKVLLDDTQEIHIHREADEGPVEAPLAKNTETAVDLGLKYMEAGLIDIALRRYEELFGRKAVLILAGGDAEIIGSMIQHDSMVIPELVLDGLALALP